MVEIMKAAAKNRQIILASRPHGEPSPDNFRLAESEMPIADNNQILLQTLWLSLDPYMHYVSSWCIVEVAASTA